MTHQGVVLQSFIICFCVLSTVTSKLSETEPSAIKESDSKSKTAQDTESRNLLLSSSSSHRTSKILKPSQIRNRRSNLLTDNEQLADDNADLDSAFFYSDQIMQNLLKTPKPLNYGRSNFFLNMLKPRTTRYNAWEDHSLMHFGKRSVDDGDGVLRNKRSVDLWLSENPKTLVPNAQNSNESPEKEISSIVSEIKPEDSYLTDSVKDDMHGDKGLQNTMNVEKKSNDKWHSMLNFGKKSQKLWDPNFEYFSKKDDPWHNTMSFGKRSLDPWNHNTMHFGKRNEPWHNMMSFGKKSDSSIDLDVEKRGDPWHNMMSFGKKSGAWHSMMNFGKKSEYPWDHTTLHFGKRDDPWHNVMSFGKRSDYPWDHNTLHFGKRDDPWHNVMSFGKRSDYPWDHNTLHFGKREDPWHNVMSFGKRTDSDDNDLEKRGDPWHNTMSFGKKSNPWHSVMSFGKKSDNAWDHNTLHFGKKDEPWHNVMSFGKRMDDNGELDADKRDDPWHNTMSFGKRYAQFMYDNSTMASKRDDPWHNTMSFGKKSDISWDHNTLHFGKRDDPWHNVMSFGKKSNIPWGEHNTLHFGKKDDPWHNVMSFGKKSDFPWDHNTLHFGKKNDPWHSMMSFGKRSNEINDYDYEELSNPWEDNSAISFDKKFDPWDHNTLHFGKKSNGTDLYISDPESFDSPSLRNVQKRSVTEWHGYQIDPYGMKPYPWENGHIISSEGEIVNDNLNSENAVKKSDDLGFYNTMHFGKKSDDWGFHNTMHFGKKRNPWDHYNTMHFGKKADPWGFHNTMHFGKRSDDAKDSKQADINQNNMNKFLGISKEEENTESKIQTKEDSTPTHKKRSVEVDKFYLTNENIAESSNKLDNKNSVKSAGSQNEKHENSIKIPEEKDSSNKKIKYKTGHDFEGVPNKEEISSKENYLSQKERPVKTRADSNPHKDTKSRIMKRSIEMSKPEKDNSDIPYDSNESLFEDNFPDTVLHFGKRSIDKFGEELSEDLWLDKKEDKRLNYWDSHNTLHFGKKSEPQDYNSISVGKKSNPWDGHNTMHFGKRNPWDYHNTLHFGKKSDPWEGNYQMHFGKKSGEWDHNVMHFGKRNEIGNNLQDFYNTEDLLFLFLSYIEEIINTLREKQMNLGLNDVEDLKLLKSLENLDVYLRDNSISTDEKLIFLESFLEKAFKTMQNDDSLEETGISDSYHSLNEFVDPNLKINMLSEDGYFSKFPSRTMINDRVFENKILPFYIENPSYEDHDGNQKLIGDLKKHKGLLKPKRGELGKPELKRYFVPFQGPKSIVYPHAWFASQIRRSAQPRTREFAKTMQMRMAEKKEDPFNSYMHFGRR